MLTNTNFHSRLGFALHSSKKVNQLSEPNVDVEFLVRLIQLKKERGFNLLYDNYSAAIYGIIIKMVTKKDIADVLLHEIFIKIWQQINDFDATKVKLFTWMLIVTRSHTIEYLNNDRQVLNCQNGLFAISKKDDFCTTLTKKVQ